MDYFKLLHFHKEPFSNSPDPDSFFQSPQHMVCLQRLELSVRMRRGLNVVIGEVGTGKTTLCRQLLRNLGQDKKIDCHLILDPSFNSAREFLVTVASMLDTATADHRATELELKETIKQYLYQRGVDDGRIVLLIIDEGQKIPSFCLEILREFLNYETNEYKLLQTVIFAQKEFKPIIGAHPNFADRIALHLAIRPLTFRDARAMIKFRLDHASETGISPPYFSGTAFWVVYQATRGFPRKIVNLCHQILVSMLIRNQSRVGWFLAYSCARKFFPEQAKQWHRALGCVTVALLAAIFIAFSGPGRLTLPIPTNAGLPPRVAMAPAVATEGVGPMATPVPREILPTGNQDRDKKTDPPPPRAPFLGEITVRQGETVGDMIRRIYGPYSFTKENLRKVMGMNRHLKRPSRLEVGDVIRFPVMPVRLPPGATRVFWVRIATVTRLDEAYRLLLQWDGKAPPMLIIPILGDGNALKGFNILLENHCNDELSARAAVATLPPPLKQGARIQLGLDRRLAYFQ